MAINSSCCHQVLISSDRNLVLIANSRRARVGYDQIIPNSKRQKVGARIKFKFVIECYLINNLEKDWKATKFRCSHPVNFLSGGQPEFFRPAKRNRTHLGNAERISRLTWLWRSAKQNNWRTGFIHQFT